MPIAEAETSTRGGCSSAASVAHSSRVGMTRLASRRARRGRGPRPPAKLSPPRLTTPPRPPRPLRRGAPPPRAPRGRLVPALGVDDLGAALALGLRLARDGALHLLGQVHVLDLDGRDLDPPRLGLAVDDLLERLVLLLALRQQLVELGLAQNRTQ